MTATTIDEVIRQLDAIIDRSLQKGDPLGAFAALYRRVTMQVKEGIANGRFEDGARMERLDVTFANRYLDAYAQFRAGRPVTRSWRIAFESARAKDLLLIQHLMMGMNAHINLDLGIAAASVAPGDQLPVLKKDFDEINGILFAMIDDVQDRIGKVSPLMWLLDRKGGVKDEQIARFSLNKARDHAWFQACRLAPHKIPDRDELIPGIDDAVALLAGLIRRPPGRFLPFTFRLVHWAESKNVRRMIEVLV